MFETDIEKILLTREEIAAKIKELAAQITADYKGEEVVLVCILNGAAPFMVDLAREINLPVYYEFMSVSSYGKSTKSSGHVRILKDLSHEIQNRNVIVVEDIVDTGLTLEYLVNILNEREPKSIKICALLDKYEARKTNVKIDYKGFCIPNAFAVGYGLDYDEKYRNLPYIGILKESVYS